MCKMSPYFWPDHGSFSSGNSFVFAVSLYVAYYAATLAAVLHAIMYASRAYRTNWFKGAIEKLEWEDVKQLMAADPVESEKDLQLAGHLLRDVGVAVVGTAVWVVGIFCDKRPGEKPFKGEHRSGHIFVRFLEPGGSGYEGHLRMAAEGAI